MGSRCAPISLSVLAALAAAARADVVAISASHDATLYQDDLGSFASGAGEECFVGLTNQNRIRRTVVSFDLAASIPAGSTITGITLTMFMDRTRSGASNIDLHPLTVSWSEGPSNPGQPGGAGAPSEPGDVTWIHRSFDTSTWTTPGGDFSPAILSSRSVSGTGAYIWPTSDLFTAAAQSWLDSPSTNFGLILVGNETTASAKRFGTRENPVVSERPKLTVTYTPVPAPAAPAALLFAAALAQKRRRR